MASTFASYFGLRSTLAFTATGQPIPAGHMYAVSSNVGPIWTNTLTVSSFSTLIGSSITISTLTGSTIVTSTITGFGISVSSISTNAITVSTITSNGITISNLNSNRALTLNTNKVVTHSVTTDTELGYLSGVTGPIQTQLGNYLPLSGGTLTGNLILNAGNVGISTTNPTAGLHIKNSTSAMRITGTLTNSSTRPSLTAVPASFEIRGSSSQGDIMNDGFLRLSAGGGSAIDQQSYIDLSGYSSQHEEMNKNIRFGTSGVERMRITSAGNVGIGTATPGASLDIPGTTKLGPLGAGITMGGVHFKVAITANENGLNPLAIGAYNDTYWCIAFLNTAGAVRGSILGVNSGSISFNTTSDQRRKDNIQDMSSMISKIKALKPRTYTWKESGDKDDGFVAQEVHKVFPQFMTSALAYCDICHHSYSDLYDGKLCECCDFENPIGKNGIPHYYGLDYGKFTPYLTKALQETIEMVETQSEQITALQAANAVTSIQMADLQVENDQLKSQISSLLTWAQSHGFSS